MPPSPPPIANNAGTLKLIHSALMALCGSANLLIGVAIFAMVPPLKWAGGLFVLFGIFQKIHSLDLYRAGKRA